MRNYPTSKGNIMLLAFALIGAFLLGCTTVIVAFVITMIRWDKKEAAQKAALGVTGKTSTILDYDK